eukprot:TRINITY_DN10404_c0_g1_i1.p1 TRINITY_DN10404_c0_g1~~TRINITY_DN10404_c0_g1_i1.p1  ORF type:complete len:458 (-),score=164.35 TRINITY_DN10404_c0_g1_i1:6-1304(-)
MINYAKFLSRRGARRQPSPIRELTKLLKIPGIISLGGGFPNPAVFPLNGLEFGLNLDPSQPESFEKVSISRDLMTASLQYSSSFGFPELVSELKRMVQVEHRTGISPKREIGEKHNWDICVTTGSQDGLSKLFDLLLDEEDVIITENPTYSGSLSAMYAIGCDIESVQTDGHGMIPESLNAILSNWRHERRPKVIYTIPTGQNPSGSTMPLSRRQEVLEIANNYDLLVIEDDPYWHMQYNKDPANPIKSLFSLDTNGRVIRTDSLSKVLSPGLRLGWVTGPSEIIERLQLDQQASCLHPCNISQAVVYEILRKWGPEGWKMHIARIQSFYKQRRDTFCSLADQHLTGLAEWTAPDAGMFVWFKCLGVDDTEALIKERAIEQKVIMVPGTSFTPKSRSRPPVPSQFVRAAFSTASVADMDEALRRFSSLLSKK